MSLMFAALRTLEGERPAAATPPRARRTLAAAGRAGAVWLGLGALLGGAAMWLAAPDAPAPQDASLPVALMAPVAAVMPSLPAPVPAPAQALKVADAAPLPVAVAVAAPPVQANEPTPPTSVAAPATALATAAPSAPARGFAPLPPGSLVVRDAQAPAPRAASHAARDADDPDPAAVARQVEAMGDAIESGDYDAAQTHLQALQHLLPAQSLTLLRMRAWLAQRRGEDAQALPLYREIVERMPGDRGAAINLALLEAGAGQLDEARQRLRRLQANEGGASEPERLALSRAMTEIGALP
ncbi:hypothetical protein P6166_12625 [Stenotrophomonas sp. HITSZ_GD]|uniref:tetratricopeptide repeat protein n=1 Tax=Stenotrophomonas sp. HITSZ_GD TaxID=3037248 RepID=UPI00240E210A|nr:tetratricopeptide repeat protein [Stenotrophomonas sp. HITSZ_GD]MDG2526200.1 hypothetical protein [Stenotrophomonas sp. HITSZ_GD]